MMEVSTLYIHGIPLKVCWPLTGRWLVVGIPSGNWPLYFGEIFRVLKPGTGWFQIVDYDRSGMGRLFSENESLPADSALAKV
jgi:hypothetical protein